MHKQLKLFLVGNSFFTLALGMIGPIYAIFVQEIGGDILAAGASWAIFMVVSGFGIFLMGKFQDKIRRDKPVMIIGYSLTALGFLGYYFVSDVAHLFMVQVLLGLGSVVYIPAIDSFYTKYLEKGKYASEWAAWEGIYFIITGVGAIVGAFLAKTFGFRNLFLAMFFSSLLGLLITATQIHENENN
jgi:MFS family permease